MGRRARASDSDAQAPPESRPAAARRACRHRAQRRQEPRERERLDAALDDSGASRARQTRLAARARADRVDQSGADARRQDPQAARVAETTQGPAVSAAMYTPVHIVEVRVWRKAV